MLKEFREFAMKGNMLDLAIGIVIGAAFGAIISSLVKDIIMPPIGMLLGGLDFSQLFVVLKDPAGGGAYKTIEEATKAGAVTLNYGLFINTIVNFLIVALALFFVVKGVNRLRKKQEDQPAPEKPHQEVVLEEIRDILKAKA
jgi:large conductance mechanosensitive channel